MYLPHSLIKEVGPWWLCLSTVTDSSVLQGQWENFNPLVSLERSGSAKQLSLVMRLNKAINNSHGKIMVQLKPQLEQALNDHVMRWTNTLRDGGCGRRADEELEIRETT